MTSYIYNMVDTWNAGGTTFTAIKMDVTDTASNAASLLMDLQVGGTSQFSVGKSGTFTAGRFGVSSFNGLRFSAGILSLSRTADGGSTIILNSEANTISVGAVISNGGNIQFAANADLLLTRRAAANLRFGAADAAAPVAQTLSVQSVVAGTTNTAGANLTITGSQGTGTGAGGSIIFQVSPAGSSGSAQNALATALTIGSDRVVTVAANASSLAQIAMADRGTVISAYATAFGTQPLLVAMPGGIQINNDTGGFWLGAAADVRLYRDAANTLALRNGTAAQRFNVYNTWTTSTNYEAFKIDWITTANTVLVGTEKGSGGGTARALEFQTDGTTKLTISTTGLVTVNNGNLSLGGSGIFITKYINNGNNSLSMFEFVADAVGTATFAVGGSAPLMRFGGTTSSFPAIKRSSTTLQARLADDSAFASVQGKLTTETAYTAGAPTSTGYLVVYDSTGTAYRIPAVLN